MSKPKPNPVNGSATRLSLAFYVSGILLIGQTGAQIAGIGSTGPLNYLLLAITGATWLGILFGPANMIEFFRAIRGNPREQSADGDDDSA